MTASDFAMMGEIKKMGLDLNEPVKDNSVQSIVKGRVRGRNVYWQPSARTMIEEGAEEAGAFKSVKMADRLRKVQQRRRMEEVRRLVVENAKFYLKKIPDLGPQKKLEDFYSTLIKESNVTKTQMMKHASAFFSDRTRQYAGLSFVKDVLQENTAYQHLSQSIKSILKNMMDSHGAEIRAGLNVSTNAAEFEARGVGKTNSLRAFYQKIILSHNNIEKTYRAIAKNIGKIDFPTMFKFLSTSVASDLKAASPSLSRLKLKQCMDDIQRLSHIQGLYYEVSDLLTGLQTKFGAAKRVTITSFFSRIIALFYRSFAMQSALENTVNDLNIKDLAPLIYFFHKLKRLLRLAPDKVFLKKRDRYALMTLVQQEIDRATMLEEN